MKTESQTEYEAFRRFLKVIASTETLKEFTRAIMQRSKIVWKMYERLEVKKTTKPENKVLLRAILEYTELLEKLEVILTKELIVDAFNIEEINVSLQVPTKEELRLQSLSMQFDGASVVERMIQKENKNPGEFIKELQKIWSERTKELEVHMILAGYTELVISKANIK